MDERLQAVTEIESTQGVVACHLCVDKEAVHIYGGEGTVAPFAKRKQRWRFPKRFLCRWGLFPSHMHQAIVGVIFCGWIYPCGRRRMLSFV